LKFTYLVREQGFLRKGLNLRLKKKQTLALIGLNMPRTALYLESIDEQGKQILDLNFF